MHEHGTFAILGSGFGMYGYLPALLEWGAKVALPTRYRPIVASRPELIQYIDRVDWCASAEHALASASGAVVALRPADQAHWIPLLANMPGIRDLLLEKPISPTPQLSMSLLSELERARKRYRVGYTFRFLPWAEQLRAALHSNADKVSVDWRFLAHHYRVNLDNWKRFNASGGGALRFYGIHLIALLAEFGVEDVSTSVLSGPSVEETSEWTAILAGRASCPVAISLSTHDKDACFKITVHREGKDAEQIVEQPDPFSITKISGVGMRDPRVDVLGRLCRSLDGAESAHAAWQQATIELWSRIEQKSRFSHKALNPSS